MISTTSALRGSEVKGQGSILASPALYKDEQNGASECCGSVVSVGGSVVSVGGFLASASRERVRVVQSWGVRVGGENLEAGTRKGARWQTRGLRGDHRRGKGQRGDHSQGELASAKAVRGERASTR